MSESFELHERDEPRYVGAEEGKTQTILNVGPTPVDYWRVHKPDGAERDGEIGAGESADFTEGVWIESGGYASVVVLPSEEQEQ